MLIIPAVDIMDRRVVQLVGGVPGSERVTMPDPVEAAGLWARRGSEHLHVIDLDGAFGKPDNVGAIKSIIAEYGMSVQVGGGVRDSAKIEALLSAGAERVIVGTKAITDTDWLAGMCDLFPGKLLLAMDTRGGEVVVKGWREPAPLGVDELFRRIRGLPLAGVLNTNVDVEGRGEGIDPAAATDFIERCPHAVVASGGVTTKKDAATLSKAGAAAAVVGMAIYTRTLRPWRWKTKWRV
ncbi:MAG: 1-(5-phosphoribosyl)-5-[(5-phosphoribosylamino)methylideneamino] imidazole-4-carboxamide isomerase [Thermoplasmatales archaeon]|nr:1-(5-phosphoribosyl)-5-[(5-phosphoribosylamino)methylideneamino] imidazole-4-carboxamide isomerase [Thermoplasmatales archaeon]